MRVLLTPESIHQEIRSGPDRHMAALLADRLTFVNEYDEGPLTVIVVEPGDTLATIDAHFDGGFLSNDQLSDGALLPEASVDQYGATLGAWMGLSSSELLGVMPNLGNFPAGKRDLGFMNT